MVKLRAPEGLSGVAVQGHEIQVASDGSVTVSERDVADLLSHGFVPWKNAAAVVSDDRRADLLKRLGALSTDDLEQLVVLAETGAAYDASGVTVAEIDSMKRQELFAFLRAQGIPAATPITNDKLRELAKGSLSTEPAAAPADDESGDQGGEGAATGTDTGSKAE